MNISDIVGLKDVVKTVVGAISDAVGAIYRPYGIRREAQANADASIIKARAEAQALLEQHKIIEDANIALPNDSIQSAPPPNELLGVAANRIGHIEKRRQSNMATVADGALDLLLSRLSAGQINLKEFDRPDSDWLVYFMELCKDVGNEDLQDLWQQVLAGEFEKPGSFSLLTLNTLRHLGSREAKTFGQLANFTWIHTDTGFLHYIRTQDTEGYIKDIGISIADKQELDSIGLIAGNISFSLSEKPEKFSYLGTAYDFTYTHPPDGLIGISDKLDTERLSSIGQQIYKLCKPTSQDLKYIEILTDSLMSLKTRSIKVTKVES